MGCSLCNNEITETWAAGTLEYRYCGRCGLVQALPRFFPDPLKEKERYLKHNNSFENSGYVKYLTDFIASAVAPYVGKGSSILDYGCGPAPVLTALLKKKDYRVTPYDPYFHADRRWKTQHFDSVVSVEVFEHLQDPLTALKEILSVLDTDGIVIIRTLLHNENQDVFSNWWYRQDCTHITFYSEKSFLFLAENFPLKILAIKNGSEIILAKTS